MENVKYNLTKKICKFNNLYVDICYKLVYNTINLNV